MKIYCGTICRFNQSDLPVFTEGDAIVCDEAGVIVDQREASKAKAKFPDAHIVDFGDLLLLPGFVDAHVHFPQLDMIGAHGEELLQWLERYTFPEEEKFADNAYATIAARNFCEELLKNGTTSAVIFASSFLEATELLLQELHQKKMLAVVGKPTMDRHAPEKLLVQPEQEKQDIENLITRWHRSPKHRSRIALMPRFAPSCSHEMFEMFAELTQRNNDLYVQTHFAENKSEIEWVEKLFPERDDYLDVYAHYNLLNDRTTLAHGVHIADDVCRRLKEAETSLVHCPTSNLFLGSGLFSYLPVQQAGVKVALGSDVGGGTSFSMWKTMAAAYQIQKIQGHSVQPTKLFLDATLGAARILHIDERVGNLQVGRIADFQVINPAQIPALNRRWERCDSIEDQLAALMIHADDRIVESVYCAGDEAWKAAR